jgi:4-amino-4-deoxy-L-arabinose transferase-like glycosyltransferase
LGTPTDSLPVGTAPRAGSRSSLATRVRELARPRRRQALAAILVLAAVCDFYGLKRNGYANLYYAAAIRSMLQSWHNFFFVSFDPGGFVSVDKPPLGFWIQAASAKLLGFSGFSILLPQALAGVASVGVLYLIVRRIFGAPAGLLAALFLALTPISVVANRNNTIDSLLVLTVLLAAYAVSRAAERGSLKWLLLCALLVGLGFNIKMLEAYLVVPAFAVVYLVGAPLGWLRRLWHPAVAGVVMLVISLSWVVAVDLTPASMRPYVGSSGTNSELELTLGYNGLQRLLGRLFDVPQLASGGSTAAAPGGVGGASENGAQGFFRLLNAQLGGQASWLLALGLVGVLATGWGLRPRGLLRMFPAQLRAGLSSALARRAAHTSPQLSALALWGVWTLTMGVFFSVAGFYHRYYLSMLAPGVAALAGVGVVLLWRDYRSVGLRDWRGWLLPAALVCTALTQAVILADYTGWNAWLTPLILGGSLLLAGVLVWLRLAAHTPASAPASAAPFGEAPPALAEHAANAESTGMFGDEPEQYLPAPEHGASRDALDALWAAPRRLSARLASRSAAALLAVTLGVALLSLGPATWVGVSLASGAGGTLPAAGPTATATLGSNFPAGPFANANGSFPRRFARGGAGGLPSRSDAGQARGLAAGGGLQVDSALVAYLEAHQGSARYLFATLSSQSAAPYIIVTGKPVLALGGFSGSDQILTLSQLKTLIREGQVRYFLAGGGGGGFGGGAGNAQLVQWIEANFSQVSASAIGGSSTGAQLYVVTAATLAAAGS